MNFFALHLCFYVLTSSVIKSSDPTTQPLLPSDSSRMPNYGSTLSDIETESFTINEDRFTTAENRVEEVKEPDKAYQNSNISNIEHENNDNQVNEEAVHSSQFQCCCILVENRLPANHEPLPMSLGIWLLGIYQYILLEVFIYSIHGPISALKVVIGLYCMLILLYITIVWFNINIIIHSLSRYSIMPASPILEGFGRKLSESYRVILCFIFAARIAMLTSDDVLATMLQLTDVHFIQPVLFYLLNVLILLYLSPCFPTFTDRPVSTDPNMTSFYIGDVLVEMNLNRPQNHLQMNRLYWFLAIFVYIAFNSTVEIFSQKLTLFYFYLGIISAFDTFGIVIILAGFHIVPRSGIHFVIEPLPSNHPGFDLKLSNAYWYLIYAILASRLALFLPEYCFILFSKAVLTFFMYFLEVLFILTPFKHEILGTFPVVVLNTEIEPINENEDGNVILIEIEDQILEHFLS